MQIAHVAEETPVPFILASSAKAAGAGISQGYPAMISAVAG
ncbi:hypothetical protein [Sphingobium sp.]